MHRTWLITLLSIALTQASAQSFLSGMVADSTTLQSLPNVNIQVKNKTYGTVTDARGFFRIQIAESDTLIFSMVGYSSRVLAVQKVRNLPVIYLREEARILKTIEINADILIPGLDKMKVMDAWENPANTYAKTPGFQGIETFGPGHTFRGGDLQHNVEEKKVKEVRAVRDKASRYIEMVNATDVKGKLMADFHITEEKYFALIAGFNQRNQSIIYELSKAELISLLTLYFSENVNRK